MLLQGELSKKRTPLELYSLIKPYLNTTKPTISKDLEKKFYEEIVPIAHFLNHEFGKNNNVEVLPNLDSKNFDATLFISKTELKIEAAYAVDGWAESDRMNILKNCGRVNAISKPIRNDNTKASGNKTVHFPNIARAHDELLQESFQLILKCLDKKSQKSYERQKYILIIAVDDHILFCTDEDKKKLETEFTNHLVQLNLQPAFYKVALVGMGGRLYLTFDGKGI